jgi:hypothetical protein
MAPCLEQEAARALHPARVRPPVLQPKRTELLEHIQPLPRADVPVTLLLDLGEDPGLGPDRCRSPIHRMAFDSRNEGSERLG